MNHEETLNLLDLAHRLGSKPGRILIAAASMGERPEPDAQVCLRRIRTNGIRGNVLAEDCARLLLTPVDSFARDSLSKALHALWQGSGQKD